MQIKFEIPFRLPSLNEYISKLNYDRYVGARFKRNTEDKILWVLKNVHQKVTGPITAKFIWYEQEKRRDKDNVCSAKKYIFDALQTSGILPNDNNKYIKDITDEFVYRQGNKVVVILTADETFRTQNMKKLEVNPNE